MKNARKAKLFCGAKRPTRTGNKVEARMQGPEGYTMTALTALKIAEKILAGNFCAGFQTPAKCYGADLILEIEGVKREDV